MKIKPSIENSTAFVDENRKFTFGIELLVMNVGLTFALGFTNNFSGDPTRDVRS